MSRTLRALADDHGPVEHLLGGGAQVSPVDVRLGECKPPRTGVRIPIRVVGQVTLVTYEHGHGHGHLNRHVLTVVVRAMPPVCNFSARRHPIIQRSQVEILPALRISGSKSTDSEPESTYELDQGST